MLEIQAEPDVGLWASGEASKHPAEKQACQLSRLLGWRLHVHPRASTFGHGAEDAAPLPSLHTLLSLQPWSSLSGRLKLK